MDTVHLAAHGFDFDHGDVGDDGMNMEWKMIIHINCGFKLINGLQIEKVCPTFANFAKNNHNHHNVAKFGTLRSQSFILR